MSHQPAGGGPVETVEVVVRLPAATLDEIEGYDRDVSYVIRRAWACLKSEEDRQADALSKLKRRPPGRPRRAA